MIVKRLSILVLAFLAASAPAFANSPHQARKLFVEGNKHFEAGRLSEALSSYRAARRLDDRASIILNIGITLHKLGRTADAANTFEEYVRHPDAKESRVDALDDTLDDLRTNLARLNIAVEEEGTEIHLDNKLIAKAPIQRTIWVTSGEHTVVLIAPAGKRNRRTLSLRPGAEATIFLDQNTPNRVHGTTSTAPSRDDTPHIQRAHVPHRTTSSRLGLIARVDGARAMSTDAQGMTFAPGVSYRLAGSRSIRLDGAVHLLIGGNYGTEVGLRGTFGSGKLRFTAGLSAPTFFVKGAKVGVRPTAGLEWKVSRRLSTFTDLGMTHTPGASLRYAKTVMLFAAGVAVSL
jgi:hypothetical protein